MRCRQLPELGRKGGIDSELWQRLIGRTLHDLPLCCLDSGLSDGLPLKVELRTGD